MTRDIEDMTDAQDEASDSLGAALTLVRESTERAVKHEDSSRWSGFDIADSRVEHPSDVDFAIAEILNAALDGRLARSSQAGDEMVARLVDAAKPFVAAMDLAKTALRDHPDVGHLETLAALYTGWTDRKELRAALAAMDTPKGGGE